MTLYTAKQIQDEIERVIKVTREETLREERQRVQNAAYLFVNTQTDERVGAAIYELMGFLYECRDEPVDVS
jgi:ribosomal protein L17